MFICLSLPCSCIGPGQRAKARQGRPRAHQEHLLLCREDAADPRHEQEVESPPSASRRPVQAVLDEAVVVVEVEEAVRVLHGPERVQELLQVTRQRAQRAKLDAHGEHEASCV